MKNKQVKASVWITLILVLCLGAVPFANAATLTIISLKCYTPEDSEVDEIKMVVQVDRSLNWSKRKNMSPGKIWNLDKQFSFTNEVVIALYDIDEPPFDPNDYLGRVIIENTPTSRGRAIFNRDGAHYELTYRVDE